MYQPTVCCAFTQGCHVFCDQELDRKLLKVMQWRRRVQGDTQKCDVCHSLSNQLTQETKEQWAVFLVLHCDVFLALHCYCWNRKTDLMWNFSHIVKIKYADRGYKYCSCRLFTRSPALSSLELILSQSLDLRGGHLGCGSQLCLRAFRLVQQPPGTCDAAHGISCCFCFT